jgi:hypothetical protein
MAKKLKVKRNGRMDMSKIPTGVKVVSVIYYISAFLFALFGLLIIVGSNAIISYLITAAPELATVKYGTLLAIGVIVGIVMIGIGILSFFIGKGLWRLRQWARIVAIIFGIFGLLSTIFSIATGFIVTQIVSLLIDGFITGYLLFSKDVKKAFK